jgi:hypothetical protein
VANAPEAAAAPAEPLRDLPTADEAPAVRPDAPAPAAAAGPQRRLSVTRRRTNASASVVPDWIETVPPLPHAGTLTAYPPPEPLFGRRTQRAILSALSETFVEEGDLDADRLTDMISTGRAIERLPRTIVPTLRRGVQLLLDRASGMDPYRADQTALVAQFDAVLAEDRFTVVDFVSCPTRAGRGFPGPRGRYQLPPRGTPILIASDLGIGGSLFDVREGDREWVTFAQWARQQGYSVVVLVPYQARRWPARLARAMTLIHWSERTTVRAVRKTLRRASVRQ